MGIPAAALGCCGPFGEPFVVAIISLVIVLLMSLLVVRIATVALTLTGLSQQSAQFQARSAWTGTGFTTTESEKVINHPVRRRIISWLILLRSAGLVTAASTLVLSFVNVSATGEGLMRFLWLVLALVLLWLVWGSEWVNRHMSRLISWALKRYTDLDTRDYAAMMHLGGAYSVVDLAVKEGDWTAGKSLAQLKLPEEGVVVLGITHPDGTFIGAPRGSSVPRPGDTLLVYGRSEELDALDHRRADTGGELERLTAVAQQRRVLREQDEQEQAAQRTAEQAEKAESQRA